MRRHSGTWFVASLVGALLVAASAEAQTPPPVGLGWKWPLYEVDLNRYNSTGEVVTTFARPAVWTSHGEFQDFGEGSDVHPGIDIRGDTTDAVIFPVGGDVLHTSNPQQCTTYNTGSKCRVWVRVGNKYIYYVGHMDLAHLAYQVMRPDARDAIARSLDQSLPPLAVQQGWLAGQLNNVSYGDWAHCHMGVFDRDDQYSSLDPIPFLDRHAVGDDGTVLDIVDDERPTVQSVVLTPATSVIQNGLCGVEVRGDIHIKADIKDTFYADPPPRTFAGDTLLPTEGPKGVRYVVRNLAQAGAGVSHQWFESPVGCSGTGCGLWRLRFRATDRAKFVDDAGFFGWLDSNTDLDGAPKKAGGDFTDSLWVVAESFNDHTSTVVQPITFDLTNNVREDGTLVATAWQTGAVDDGRYVVSVEAWDNDGNVGGQSQLVTVNNQGALQPPTTPTKGWAEIIVKDNANDVGQIPSNLGGDPWWVSEDILVMPAGVVPTCSSPARGSPLIVNDSYDVYVRAHNIGCQDMPNVRAAVYSASPGTMLTDFRSISLPAGVYAGNPVPAPAGDCALVGPFPWTPTQADLGGASQDGHRCLLAAITSDIDPGPSPATPSAWVPKDDDNTTQRNVQISGLDFFIRNATTASGSVELRLDMGTFPHDTAGASFKLLVDDPTSELASRWQGAPGTVVSTSGTNAVVEVHAGTVTLPAFDMPAISAKASTVDFTLPTSSGPHHVVLTQYLNGVEVGGMEFILSGPPPVR